MDQKQEPLFQVRQNENGKTVCVIDFSKLPMEKQLYVVDEIFGQIGGVAHGIEYSPLLKKHIINNDFSHTPGEFLVGQKYDEYEMMNCPFQLTTTEDYQLRLNFDVIHYSDIILLWEHFHYYRSIRGNCEFSEFVKSRVLLWIAKTLHHKITKIHDLSS